MWDIIIGILVICALVGVFVAALTIVNGRRDAAARQNRNAATAAQHTHQQALQAGTTRERFALSNTGPVADLVVHDFVALGDFYKSTQRFGLSAVNDAVHQCKEVVVTGNGWHTGPGERTLLALAEVEIARNQGENMQGRRHALAINRQNNGDDQDQGQAANAQPAQQEAQADPAARLDAIMARLDQINAAVAAPQQAAGRGGRAPGAGQGGGQGQNQNQQQAAGGGQNL